MFNLILFVIYFQIIIDSQYLFIIFKLLVNELEVNFDFVLVIG